jgi:hypothetical protein
VKKRLAVILTAVCVPLAVAPPVSADPIPNIGPSGCIESGMPPDRCDANYIKDLNAVGIGTWSELDDGSPYRANAIEAAHHIVNFLNSSIIQAAKNGGGSAGAQDVVNAFSATAQRYQSDTNAGGRCANPGPCDANNVNIEQATRVVQAAVHWFGPPGMEDAVRVSFQEVRGGGG